jgi:hypothetical protein
MIRRKIFNIGFLFLSQVLFVTSVLPETLHSKFLFMLSYDNQIEHINILVIIIRIACLIAGEIFLILSFSSLRQPIINTCLPYPANSFRLPPPGMANTTSWFVMIIFCSICVLPVHLGLIINPVWLHPLLREDGIFEMFQAGLYFAGGAIMIYGSFRSIRGAPAARLPFLFWGCMGFLMIFIGLEEISYGQRIIGFSTHEYFHNLNRQNEFNFHNVATGLFNRLAALVMISFGFFLPAIALFSTRVSYLFTRYKAEFIAGPSMLCFAMGAMYYTPKNYNMSRIDEQSAICFLTCIILLLLLGRSFIIKKHRKSTIILGIFCLAAFLTIAINLIFITNWPAGNYAEEVKETLIPCGLFCYSINIFKNTFKLKHPF